MFLRAIGTGVLSGLMLALGWPPTAWSFLLLIAFMPLLLFIQNRKTALLPTLLASCTAFFIWYAGAMYWTLISSGQWTDRWLTAATFLLVPLLMCLPVAVYKLLAVFLKYDRTVLIFPLCWLGYEYVQMQWEYGFKWLQFGFGFSHLPGFASLYRWFTPGIVGVLVLLFNALLASVIQRHKYGNSCIRAEALCLGLLVLSFIPAFWHSDDEKNTRHIRVVVVQPDSDVHRPLDEHSLYKQVMALKEMLAPVGQMQVNLVVCPEGYLRSRREAPIVINDLANNPAVREIQKISASIAAPILCGFIGVYLYDKGEKAPRGTFSAPDGRRAAWFNAAMMITPGGGIGLGFKKQLVPFMERFPASSSHLHLSLNQMQKTYCSLDTLTVFKYKDLLIAPLICMDVIDYQYASAMRKAGANLIVHISNDDWAGTGASARQNEAYAQVISQSCHLPVVRANMNGLSGFMDEHGNIPGRMSPHKKGILIKEVKIRIATGKGG